MKFTISKMESKSPIINNDIVELVNGYSFIDEFNHCIIVVYGEKEMKAMIKYLKR